MKGLFIAYARTERKLGEAPASKEAQLEYERRRRDIFLVPAQKRIEYLGEKNMEANIAEMLGNKEEAEKQRSIARSFKRNFLGLYNEMSLPLMDFHRMKKNADLMLLYANLEAYVDTDTSSGGNPIVKESALELMKKFNSQAVKTLRSILVYSGELYDDAMDKAEARRRFHLADVLSQEVLYPFYFSSTDHENLASPLEYALLRKDEVTPVKVKGIWSSIN